MADTGGGPRKGPPLALQLMLDIEKEVVSQLPRSARRQFYELLSWYRQRGHEALTMKHLVVAIEKNRGQWYADTFYRADLMEIASQAMDHFRQIDIPAPSLTTQLMEAQ